MLGVLFVGDRAFDAMLVDARLGQLFSHDSVQLDQEVLCSGASGCGRLLGCGRLSLRAPLGLGLRQRRALGLGLRQRWAPLGLGLHGPRQRALLGLRVLRGLGRFFSFLRRLFLSFGLRARAVLQLQQESVDLVLQTLRDVQQLPPLRLRTRIRSEL